MVEFRTTEVIQYLTEEGPRDIVVVNISNYGPQAFYRSTGENSGKPGQWFPFDGINELPQNNGWIHKTRYTLDSQDNNLPEDIYRYGTIELKEVSKELTSSDIPAGRIVPKLRNINTWIDTPESLERIEEYKEHFDGDPKGQRLWERWVSEGRFGVESYAEAQVGNVSNFEFRTTEVIQLESREGPRDIVVVDVPDHGLQSFYRSTGKNSGKPGEWLPFDGLSEIPMRHGWLDKTRFTEGVSEELSRYGTPQLRDISQELTLSNIPEGRVIPSIRDINKWIDTPKSLEQISTYEHLMGGDLRHKEIWEEWLELHPDGGRHSAWEDFREQANLVHLKENPFNKYFITQEGRKTYRGLKDRYYDKMEQMLYSKTFKLHGSAISAISKLYDKMQGDFKPVLDSHGEDEDTLVRFITSYNNRYQDQYSGTFPEAEEVLEDLEQKGMIEFK